MGDLLNSFALAHHMHMGEWPKDGIHTLPGNTDYRYIRISPSMYRSTEIPAIGECLIYENFIWHIQPAKGIFYRVELL